MKRIILFLLAISSIGFIHAQIGINTTDPHVTLDVQAAATDGTTAEGIAAPRLTLAQLALKDSKYTLLQTGAIVYVTNLTGPTTAKTINVISIGNYYFDGTLWQTMGPDQSLRFFYMPSTPLPVDTSDPSYNAGTQIFTIDLYTSYANQFGLTNSTNSTKNPTGSSLPVISSSALDYFITYFDNTVYQNVAVSDAGVLTYQLAAVFTITNSTFMNILLKVK